MSLVRNAPAGSLSDNYSRYTCNICFTVAIVDLDNNPKTHTLPECCNCSSLAKEPTSKMSEEELADKKAEIKERVNK